ncbi:MULTISPECIES: hypothetical protein [Psychrobacter]|uniref:hypothetical protein n=1 Tax=Psychrobacter TaxID=497 RepID=UPI001D11AF24|nr:MULTISPECIES: hypothetical protein [Psychrobacter]
MSIESIVFYSTDHPVVTLNRAAVGQTTNDWYNALFADSISFNRAVTSHYMTGSGTQYSNLSKQLSTTLSSSSSAANVINDALSDHNILVGYINITIDIDKLRWNWFFRNIWLWLATIGLSLGWIYFILRKLNWLSKDIANLAKVCEIGTYHLI